MDCKCSESDLETLVFAGFLAHKSVIQWCPALGEDRLYENMGEIVAFTTYLERGFGATLFFFLLWSPVLLQDLAASLDPQFLYSHFYLCAFVRSFSGHRAPF